LARSSYTRLMFNSLRQTWGREAVAYRRGELDDGDGVATMVVTLIGGPALVVGAVLITDGGLGLGQVLLAAPLGALLGAVLVGSSAIMAAQTGANGTWLLRPAFGRGGSVLVSLCRLLAVALWAVIGLQIAGEWAGGSATGLGVDLPAVFWVGVVAALGLLLVLLGLVTTVRVVIRKPLFIASVLLVAVAAWQLAGTGGAQPGVSGASFWAGMQLTVEAAVIFLPFVEALARRLEDDEGAMTSFAVAYAVPATLMFAAGGVIAYRLGGLEDLTGIGAGSAGMTLVVVWVLVMEVDQAFSAFVAAGAEAVGVMKIGAAWFVGLIAVIAVIAVALMVTEVPASWGFLAAAGVFPAALISVTNFHLARDRHYTEVDIYGSMEGLVNVAGVGCWLGAVAIGQLLDPVGPAEWLELIPTTAATATDLPWRLIVALVAATVYLLIERWGTSRRAAVYQVRGVEVYGHEGEAGQWE
jgi:purine-cytosine permease-like protein